MKKRLRRKRRLARTGSSCRSLVFGTLFVDQASFLTNTNTDKYKDNDKDESILESRL